MDGGIYTREICLTCGERLKDNHRNACECPNHPEVRARRLFVKFPGGLNRKFTSYDQASKWLNHLRHEKDTRKELFSPEDYKAARPNSFNALKDKYLERKKNLETYKKIQSMIERASEKLGHKNLREITGADIEDYLYSIPGITEKTRANHCSQLHDFWTWALRRGNIITLAEFPAFPEIDYELGYRKITDWATQEAILDKLNDISYHINPKIWLGVAILSTHTRLRPEDLRRCRENSLRNGILFCPKPSKEKGKFKMIRLHPDHVKAWEKLARLFPATPEAYFFRHTKGLPGCSENERFGNKLLNVWFKKAAALLNVNGVTLYGGTKHTTATETARLLGKDTAKKASGLSNKAAERYIMVEDDGILDIVTAVQEAKKKAKVVQFKKRR